MSLFKIEFLSFIITMNEFTGIQNAGAKRNLVSRFFLNLHYYFLSNYQDFLYINEAINILENNKSINKKISSNHKRSKLILVRIKGLEPPRSPTRS